MRERLTGAESDEAGMGRSGTKRDGAEWDKTGWGGVGQNGMERSGTGWDKDGTECDKDAEGKME